MLTDFPDARAEHLPGEDEVLAAATTGIEALNARYAPGTGDRFYLFHRARRWNASEGVWMGWERKRGKIEEFNRLLRGADDTSFTVQVGAPEILTHVRYCITLDSDTRLPRDAARQLIGVIEHPLNRPRFDPKLRRVVEGYGILQPRVSVTMASAAGSLFARAYAGHTGVDPYTTAVSDTYQDLFGEGIFTGKGLLRRGRLHRGARGSGRGERDALARPVRRSVRTLRAGVGRRGRGRLPLERVGPRAAPAPLGARRLADPVPRAAAGAHPARRGTQPAAAHQPLEDPRQPAPQPGGAGARRIPGLGVDLAPGFAARLDPGGAGGARVPVAPAAGAPCHGPAPAAAVQCVCARRVGGARDRGRTGDAPDHAARRATRYEMVHAIVLTLIRMVITQRRLLEWETAAATAARSAGLLARQGPRVFVAEMWAGPAAALVVLLGVLPLRASALPVALPFLAAWMASPVVAWWLSRRVVPRRLALSVEDAAQLRRVARRTWRYFETFVGEQDHWLPPDNVQIDSRLRVAHRTSPTNIGMGLLSTLAAHDLGYLGTAPLANRIESMLASVEALERHEGHLLNWYDTVNLAPLAPRYVSTVDSGNLAGALMALSAGLREVAEGEEDEERACAGASDTAGVLAEALTVLERGAHATTPLRSSCRFAKREVDALREMLGAGGPGSTRLEVARGHANAVQDALEQLTTAAPVGPETDAVAEWGRLLDLALIRSPEHAARPERVATAPP